MSRERTRAGEKPRGAPASAGRPAPPGLGPIPPELAVVALLLVVGRVALWFAEPLASEDAYITFRYANMLATGHGLVYNAGERVMGFTSLPWTLWCALGTFARVDPVVWTRLTSLVADVATLWLGWRMLARTSPAPARAFALFFSAWPMFAAANATGLEVNAFLALAFLSAWLVSRNAPAAGPVLGLFAVMRPEGLAAALVLGLAASWRARLVALGIVGVTAAGLFAYYGSPVPQSVVAKAMLYGTPGPWAGRHWWEWLLPFPLGRFPVASEGQHLLPIAVLFAATVVVGARSLWRERRSAAALAAGAGLAVWLGYAVLGVAYFWWYMVLPLGAFGLLAAHGFSQVVRGRAIPVAAALMVLGTWTVAIPIYVGREQAEANSFVPPARFLAARATAGQCVLLEPIGLIGYRTGLRVLDESGLVSPAIAVRRVRGAGWYADEIRRSRPDWLVVRAAVLQSGQAFAGAGAPFRNATEREATLAGYELARAASPERGDPLAVYRRKPSPAPAAAP